MDRWPAEKAQRHLPARSSPGYHPPRPGIPLKDRQRQARQDWILMRVATIVLILAAVAFMVIMTMIIAAHS